MQMHQQVGMNQSNNYRVAGIKKSNPQSTLKDEDAGSLKMFVPAESKKRTGKIVLIAGNQKVAEWYVWPSGRNLFIVFVLVIIFCKRKITRFISRRAGSDAGMIVV
jgi:hypothetical protein